MNTIIGLALVGPNTHVMYMSKTEC